MSELDLYSNNIGEWGAVALADAVKVRSLGPLITWSYDIGVICPLRWVGLWESRSGNKRRKRNTCFCARCQKTLVASRLDGLCGNRNCGQVMRKHSLRKSTSSFLPSGREAWRGEVRQKNKMKSLVGRANDGA